MKKKVSLFILFILLFISIYNLGSILFFNKYFINNYDIENKIFDKSSNIYSFIPNMRLHISDKNQSLNNAIKLYNINKIIFEGCSCKDALLHKWLNDYSKDKILYIYLNKESYNNDKLSSKYDNVIVALCNYNDVINYYTPSDYTNFPILYKVNDDQLIIDKYK